MKKYFKTFTILFLSLMTVSCGLMLVQDQNDPGIKETGQLLPRDIALRYIMSKLDSATSKGIILSSRKFAPYDELYFTHTKIIPIGYSITIGSNPYKPLFIGETHFDYSKNIFVESYEESVKIANSLIALGVKKTDK